jgi:prophage maintenance system killer protein
MAVFLLLNGFNITADMDSQEQTTLGVASGKLSREDLRS